jgi:hypothetical protein
MTSSSRPSALSRDVALVMVKFAMALGVGGEEGEGSTLVAATTK